MPEFVVLQAFDFFLFNNSTAFLLFIVMLGGVAGLIARSLAVGAFGAFLIFTHVAINSDTWIFTELLYAVLVICFFVMSFRLVSFALSEAGSD